MKNLKYNQLRNISITGMFAMVFIVTACGEDFLDKTPVSRPSTKSYYKNERDINGALTAMYDQFNNLADNIVTLNGFRSDNFYYWQYEGHAFANNDWANWGSPLWSGLFNLVFRSNQIINSLPNVEMENKRQYEAEAKFMRGYAYFWLVRAYGQLPIVTKKLTREEAMKMSRQPLSDIYAQIEEDLNFAVNNLSEEITKGRANKYVAEAILTRAYITQSGYPVNADKYGDAIPLLEDIIQSGKYKLQENYADIFTLDGENGPEVIWSAVMDDDPKGNQHSTAYMLDPNAGGRSTSLAEFKPGGENHKGDIWNSFEPGDVRRNVSLDTVGVNNRGQTWKRINNEKYKYGYVQGVGWTSDYIFVRYANILLLYAEALHETGQASIIEDKWGIINQIRNRAELEDVSGGADFKDVLLNERRHEFVWEGVRWFDLVRTNRFVDELKKVQHENAADFWKFLPIPKTEMDKMGNQWENNEGYEW